MKVGNVIPKKASKHSQGSVAQPECERHKAYFSLKPIEWDKDKDKQIKCKPPSVKQGKSAGFEKILYQLQGDEPPEKFILWIKDLNDKVVTSKPDWDLIFMSLIDLTDKLANAVIRAALDDFHDLKLTYGDYGPFRNLATQKKILLTSTDTDGTMMDATAGQAEWDRLVGKLAEINPLILKEIIFQLQEFIFGTDMVGRNAYYLL